MIAFAAGRGENGADLGVSFPNVAYDAGNARSYLRTSVLPVPVTPHGINNGEALYQWIAQVSVYVRDGLGEVVATDLADAIRAAFPFNRQLTSDDHAFNVRSVSIASPIALDGWFAVPVSIRMKAVA